MYTFKTISKGILLSLVSVSALLASPSKTELEGMKKIVGYFPEWGIYDGHKNYLPENVPFNKITHLNYAFATIKDGLIADFDSYAASEVTHGEAWDSPYKGNLGQFEKLKTDYPHISIMISIGGWSQSGNFHDVAATQEARDIFASSVVQYIREHKMDGVDIDWEYPGSYREPDLVDNPNDQGTPKADASEKETFKLLLQTLRTHLDTAGTQDGKYYQLTAAVSASFSNIDFSEPQYYAQYLDFINIMTYDLHGAWDAQTNHQSALYPKEELQDNLNIDDVVKKFIALGVNKNKLIIGTPFYSRGWKGVIANSPENGLVGLLADASGGADGIWDGGRAAGQNPYYHLVELENNPEYVKYYDTQAEAPYLYNAVKGEMYTYEDKQSLGAKVAYVNNNDLGGIIIWELSADVPSTDSRSLLNVIAEGFYPNGIDINSSTSTEPTLPTEETAETVDIWSSSEVYTSPDEVQYEGVVYRAKWWTQGDIPGAEAYGPWESVGDATEEYVENNTSTPENNTSEPENSTPSEETNTTTISSGTWDVNTVYTGGEVVSYNSTNYQAKWWTQGDVPGAEQWGPWEAVDASVTPPENGENTNTESNTSTTTEENTTVASNGTVSLETLQAQEEALTNTPLMEQVKVSIRTLDNVEVERIVPLRAENPSNVRRVESIVTMEDWDYLFPQRSSEYTYDNFLKATGKFPAFCGDYEDGRDAELICRKSLATMFAHFAQETGGTLQV